MSIRVVCPSCDKVYNLDESLQGKRVVCRECKQPMEVPAAPRRERRDEDRPSRDDRIKSSSGSRGTEVRSRRDEDDEPRRRPAERSRDRDLDDEPRRDKRPERSRLEDEEPQENKNLMPILIGAGAGAVVLIALGAGGLYFALRGGSSGPPAVANQQTFASATNPGAAAGGDPAGGAPAGGGNAGAPDGPVPSEMAANVVQQVKQSTAYLRVNLPNRSIAQGSGFFALERGIVITNAHVLGMLRADSLPPSNVDVVVNSGDPGEMKLTGTVLGVDRDNDLAVLRVNGDPSRLPPPLAVDTATKLTETQKLYVFGFPLGTALGKNITVTTSAVASLRRSDGVLKQVQVNGGMHQGNSGGPVTDARGVVVGVSVAGIPGTTINFAIPGDFVKEIVNGKPSATEMGFAYRNGSETRLPVRLSCLDPMNRIREVKVEVWTGQAGAGLPASSTAPPARPGEGQRQSFSLSAKDRSYVGDVVLPSALGGQVVWIQPMVSGGGRSHWGKSVVVPAEAQNPIERRGAMVQFKVPASPIERTLKLNSHVLFSIFKGSESATLEEKLEGNAVEFLRPDPGKNTPILLVLGNCPYSRRVGDTLMQPPPQANQILRRYTASWTVNASHSLQSYSRNRFTTLRSAYRDTVIEMYNTICNTYEETTLTLPNRMVAPQETWPAKMPLAIVRDGKRTIQDILVTCTFEGILTVNGRSQACISLKGRVKGRKEQANLELGKVSGYAHIDIDGGFVNRVKLTTMTEIDNEGGGSRVLVQDTSSVERTEGNSLGLKPPPSGPIAKDGPPDKTKPGGPAGPPPGGTLQQDAAALKGTWQSAEFAGTGGVTGSIKLQFNPAEGRPTGQVKVEISAKRGGRSAGSSTTVNFTLAQQGETRQIRGISRRKLGLNAAYRFDGEQLILSGSAAVLGVTLPMNQVAFRRTSADGSDMPAGGSPAAGGNVLTDTNKLPEGIFAVVQAAVAENRLSDVDVRGFTLGMTDKDKYRDVCDEGGVLIGFEVGQDRFGGGVSITSLRPIFLTKKGERFGKWQGKVPATSMMIKAKPGHAVSGMAIRTGVQIFGFTLTFSKLGKDRLELGDKYDSELIGDSKIGSLATIGGKGALFVGVTGYQARDKVPCALGLVAVQPK
jgi:S1-C subfamily serine protease